MMKRRTVLGLLAGTATTVSSGCAKIGDRLLGSGSDEPTGQRQPEYTGPGLQDLEQQALEFEAVDPDEGPTFEFDYERKTFDAIPGPNFERLDATGAVDVGGDHMRVSSDGIGPTELATRLRIAWETSDAERVSGTLDGTDVEFVGGENGRYSYLVGHTAEQVVAVRAESMDAVRELVDSL